MKLHIHWRSRRLWAALVVALLGGAVLAQIGGGNGFGPFGGGRFGGGGGRRGRRGGGFGGFNRTSNVPAPPREIFPGDEFVFCRIRYNNGPYDPNTFDGQGWSVDYPQADSNLSLRLEQMTTLRVGHTTDGHIQRALMTLTDPEIDKYPIIFFSELGGANFTDEECAAFRSYLLRGGFFLADDCHGDVAWANIVHQFDRVLPKEEYPLVEIPITHEIFHIVYDFKECPQVPTIHQYDHQYYIETGDTLERNHDYSSGDTKAHVRGIFDKNGRLMGVVNFNTDLGDGWQEEGSNIDYFNDFSAKKAFPMGINQVTYAMTH